MSIARNCSKIAISFVLDEPFREIVRVDRTKTVVKLRFCGAECKPFRKIERVDRTKTVVKLRFCRCWMNPFVRSCD